MSFFRFIKGSLPGLTLITYYLRLLIINTSIITSAYPSLWKRDIITSVLKSVDAGQMNKHRPNTLLPVIPKVLKKIENQITTYLITLHLKCSMDLEVGFPKTTVQTNTKSTKTTTLLQE